MDHQTSQRLLTKIREKRAGDQPRPVDAKVQLLAKIREKRAAEDPTAILDRLSTENIKQNTMGDVGNTAMMALGLGVAARGGLGLYNVLRRNLQPRQVRSTVKALPLPFPEEEEEEDKYAEDGGIPAPPGGESWFNSPVTKKEGLWWRKPGMLLGGMAGAYGGWKLVDSILDKRRASEVDEELNRAKDRFRSTMLAGYDKPFKKAEDNAGLEKLGEDLDSLFNMLEKTATFGDTVGDMVGNYGLYAAPAALITGYAAYEAARKRRRANVLKKALQRRERHRQMRSPSPLFATPVPVPRPQAGAESLEG